MYIYWCFAMFLLLDLFVTAYICYFVVVFLHIIKNTYKTTRRFHFSSCSFAFSPRKSDGWFELKPALQLDCLCKKWWSAYRLFAEFSLCLNVWTWAIKLETCDTWDVGISWKTMPWCIDIGFWVCNILRSSSLCFCCSSSSSRSSSPCCCRWCCCCFLRWLSIH